VCACVHGGVCSCAFACLKYLRPLRNDQICPFEGAVVLLRMTVLFRLQCDTVLQFVAVCCSVIQ